MNILDNLTLKCSKKINFEVDSIPVFKSMSWYCNL